MRCCRLPIGGRVVALEHAAKAAPPAVPVAVGHTTDMNHYGQRRISTELTPDFFDTFIREHDAVLINFHAPWWCAARMFASGLRARG